MVIAVKDIGDGARLEDWLNERPVFLQRKCSVFISSRVAARVAPFALEWFRFEAPAFKSDLTTILFCRSVLSSCVGVMKSTSELRAANRSISRIAQGISERILNTEVEYSSNAIFAASAAVHSVNSASTSSSHFAVHSVNFLPAESFSACLSDCNLWLSMEEWKGIDDDILQSTALWPYVNPLAQKWTDLKVKLIEDASSDDPKSADWSFWIDWYDGLLEGRAQNIDMLHEIVTTDKIDWDAPPREVNEAIAEIVERYGPQIKVKQTKITQSQIQRTKSAIQENKNALPPTLECIEFLIENEIQRLQQKNYANDFEMEESKRLISVFMQLLSATRTLSTKVVIDEIGDDEATEVISTLGVYNKLMTDWPREYAPEVVDNVFRLGLMGSATGVFVMCGLSEPVSAAFAGATFGGKKLAEVANVLIKGSGT